MEVTSRFVEDTDLGRLHVVRFTPDDARPDEHASVFNSFNGRVTTIDGFAVPYVFAEISGIVTDFIERPGTGSSSPIADRRLRKNYGKHGFLEIADAIPEALAADPLYMRAQRLHAAGFSLGGHAAALYLDAAGERAAGATLIDAPGLCSVNRIIGSGRYFGYLAVETAAKLAGVMPDKEGLYSEQEAAFHAFLEETGLTDDYQHHLREKCLEFHEVTQPTQGEALRAVSNVMRDAAADERPFELRASFSPMRFLTDHRAIKETNEMVARFDKKYPDQATVSYGFLQRDGMNWWHDFSTNPSVIRRLMQTPISALRNRLLYFR